MVEYLWKKFGVFFVAGAILFACIGILNLISIVPYYLVKDTYSFIYLLEAIASTLGRLGIAYMLALLVGVPLALIFDRNPRVENALFPFFEVIQSVPVLAIFPIFIILFSSAGYVEGTVIAIIFLSMLWNIVFNLVNGLKFIPRDVTYVAQVFKLKGLRYYTEILFPAMTPYLVVGSFVAWAQGWNIIIMAEVLHIFVPYGIITEDVFGIGSILINAVTNEEVQVFTMGLILLVLVIGLINLFVWQKLLAYSERFKFK